MPPSKPLTLMKIPNPLPTKHLPLIMLNCISVIFIEGQKFNWSFLSLQCCILSKGDIKTIAQSAPEEGFEKLGSSEHLKYCGPWRASLCMMLITLGSEGCLGTLLYQDWKCGFLCKTSKQTNKTKCFQNWFPLWDSKESSISAKYTASNIMAF